MSLLRATIVVFVANKKIGYNNSAIVKFCAFIYGNIFNQNRASTVIDTIIMKNIKKKKSSVRNAHT